MPKRQKANPATDFEYDFNKDNETLYIKWYKGTSTTVVIPAEIEGMKVTIISWNRGNVETVVIPEGVTEIGGSAFYGVGGLKSVQSIKFVGTSYMGQEHFKGSQPPLLIRKRLQELGYTGRF